MQEDDIDAAFGEDGEEDAELDDDDDNNNDQQGGDDEDGGEEGDIEDNPDEAAEGTFCYFVFCFFPCT